MSAPDLDAQRASDAAELERLGYKQELSREMGGFANFALAFSVLSILTGAVTLYGHGLRYGGPLGMNVGWIVVSLMTLAIAGSLAQLASSFPTAGALYHWSAMLGGPGWGFLTAWLNTIGQFAITAGIDYGLAEFIADAFGWQHQRGVILGLYAALLLSHAILNHIGVRVVAWLNDVSAWYHIVGTALLIGALLFFAPKQPISFIATRFTSTEYPYWYAFLIGLLQAQWTFTGYDASAHVTEETVDPSRNAPRGIMMAVILSAVAGYLMLVALTLAIPSLPDTAAANNPFAYILTTSLGPRLGGLLVWMVIGAMWFCGLSSVTSNSRMLFAFARDDGMPLSAYLKRVSPTHKTPHIAVWLSVSIAFCIALWAEAYSAMVALSTIAILASYGVPIAIGLFARRSGRWTERGPWDLGRWSQSVNIVALTWITFISVVFVLPPNQLAGYTFAGCLAVLAIYWFAYMRARFKGPKVHH